MKSMLTCLSIGFVISTSLPVQAETEIYPGTLYRNGGHFGLANSDAKLEHDSAMFDSAIIAGAPSSDAGESEAKPGQAWQGTLYRNGGHFGLENSDDNLEMQR